jgi:hypothetical protein
VNAVRGALAAIRMLLTTARRFCALTFIVISFLTLIVPFGVATCPHAPIDGLAPR